MCNPFGTAKNNTLNFMKRLLIIAIIIFSLSACGKREYILKDNKFDELRLIENEETENVWITKDAETINKLKDEVYYIDNEDCHGTTPDYAIQFFLNGKEVETYSYCHYYQTNLDNLKNKLHKTKQHKLEFKNKQEWQNKLKLLYSNNLSSVNYISPDSISVFGYGVLNIKITDSTKEEEQKHTQKLFDTFKELYKLNDTNFSVAGYEFFSNGTINYKVSIRCDKEWSENFESSKLKSKKITSVFEIHEFEPDEYKIYFRDWKE